MDEDQTESLSNSSIHNNEIEEVYEWNTSLLSEVKKFDKNFILFFCLTIRISNRFVVKVISIGYVSLLTIVGKCPVVLNMPVKLLIDLMSKLVFHHYIMPLVISSLHVCLMLLSNIHFV